MAPRSLSSGALRDPLSCCWKDVRKARRQTVSAALRRFHKALQQAMPVYSTGCPQAYPLSYSLDKRPWRVEVIQQFARSIFGAVGHFPEFKPDLLGLVPQ